MTISRRRALKSLGAVAASPIFRVKPDATSSGAVTPPGDSRGLHEDSRGFHLQVEALDPAALAAIAEIVLPSEADRAAAVAAFTRWIESYKEGADTDHGYGNTRIRSTAPSPARNYPAQIAALDAVAKAKGAAGFAAATLDLRRAIVEAAIADAKVERATARPTGAHIATDLMGHYFNSPAASDLCYRAAIGRDSCPGLPGSEKKPAALAPRAPNPPREGGSHEEARGR
jgi:hypothetical protein